MTNRNKSVIYTGLTNDLEGLVLVEDFFDRLCSFNSGFVLILFICCFTLYHLRTA